LQNIVVKDITKYNECTAWRNLEFEAKKKKEE